MAIIKLFAIRNVIWKLNIHYSHKIKFSRKISYFVHNLLIRWGSFQCEKELIAFIKVTVNCDHDRNKPIFTLIKNEWNYWMKQLFDTNLIVRFNLQTIGDVVDEIGQLKTTDDTHWGMICLFIRSKIKIFNNEQWTLRWMLLQFSVAQ